MSEEYAILEQAISGELGATHAVCKLTCTSGKIVAADPLVNPDRAPCPQDVPSGTYEASVVIHEEDERVAFAILKISDGAVASWDWATSYGVDAGFGCYMDVDTQQVFLEVENKLAESPDFCSYYDDVIDELTFGSDDFKGFLEHRPNDSKPNNIAWFESGWGDGGYDVFVGLDADGKVVCFVTDFQLYDEDDE